LDDVVTASIRRLTLDVEAMNPRRIHHRDRKQVPFERGFVYAESGQTPLDRLISGDATEQRMGSPGRGGLVRLRMYLCMTLMAATDPWDLGRTKISLRRWYSDWSVRVGLDGPTAHRRIAYNLGWLRSHQFIEVEPRRGYSPVIKLLDINGTDQPYRNPRPTKQYVQLPTGFFTNGWLVQLSPVAVGMVMILLNQKQASEPVRWPVSIPGYDRDRYGLSENSLYLGARQLTQKDLLTVERDRIDEEEYQEVRVRNLYTLHEERFTHNAAVTR
jgi:hypothetical protein